MIDRNLASRLLRIVDVGHRLPRRRASFEPRHLALEDRCLPSVAVPNFRT